MGGTAKVVVAAALTGVLGIAGGMLIAGPGTVTNSSAAPAHRYSTQTLILMGIAGSAVAITDHQEQKLYYYSSEAKELQLRETIDLSRTGQPTIERVKSKREEAAEAPAAEGKPSAAASHESSATTAASTEPKKPKKREERDVLRVRVDKDGKLTAPQGYALGKDDLPVFAKEIAAGKLVIVTNSSNMNLSQLVAARDHLKIAGIAEVTIQQAPDDPGTMFSPVLDKVRVYVDEQGQLDIGNGVDIADGELSLLKKEIVHDKPVIVKSKASSIPLTQLIEIRDRLKAAGIDASFEK